MNLKLPASIDLSCFVNKVFICEICVIKAKIYVVVLLVHKLCTCSCMVIVYVCVDFHNKIKSMTEASPCMLNVSVCFYEPQGIGKCCISVFTHVY